MPKYRKAQFADDLGAIKEWAHREQQGLYLGMWSDRHETGRDAMASFGQLQAMLDRMKANAAASEPGDD